MTNASFSKSKYNLIWHLSKNFDTPHELGYPLYVLIFLPATEIKEVRLEHVNIEGKISTWQLHLDNWWQLRQRVLLVVQYGNLIRFTAEKLCISDYLKYVFHLNALFMFSATFIGNCEDCLTQSGSSQPLFSWSLINSTTENVRFLRKHRVSGWQCGQGGSWWRRS